MTNGTPVKGNVVWLKTHQTAGGIAGRDISCFFPVVGFGLRNATAGFVFVGTGLAVPLEKGCVENCCWLGTTKPSTDMEDHSRAKAEKRQYFVECTNMVIRKMKKGGQ